METRHNSTKHFVLVHGACHGAWCWYKLATLLRSDGHTVTALDMAASGIHPKQVDELRSFRDYYEPLMDFMATLPPDNKVILVGHSLGGVSISVAMERFPQKISVAVFVTAIMAGPDLTFPAVSREIRKQIGSYMDSTFTYGKGPENPATSVLYGPQFMASKLYQLSPPEDFTLAQYLVRPNAMYEEANTLRETKLTKENFGSVRRAYIVCEKDNVFQEEIQWWMIEKNPVDEVQVISGSDHMAMFSKPQELCSCLQAVADKYY